MSFYGATYGATVADAPPRGHIQTTQKRMRRVKTDGEVEISLVRSDNLASFSGCSTIATSPVGSRTRINAWGGVEFRLCSPSVFRFRL